MPQSTLPLTGFCHYCGSQTPYRFCVGTTCRRMYHYRKAHPQIVFRKGMHVKSLLTMEQRMDNIVARNESFDNRSHFRDYRQGEIVKGAKL